MEKIDGKKALIKLYDTLANESMPFIMLADEKLESKVNQFTQIIKKGQMGIYDKNFEKATFKKELEHGQKVFQEIYEEMEKQGLIKTIRNFEEKRKEILNAINEIKKKLNNE